MTKNMKINKKILFKTTSALTCLMGAVLLFNQTANATTSTGTMTVTTTVANVCTVSATELAFGAYANLNATKNSTVGGGVISTNCSGAIAHVLSVATAATAGLYTMITDDGATTDEQITFQLRNTSLSGSILTGGSVIVTATGTGSAAEVATLFGIIQAQTGKVSGSYTTSITLNAVYN